MPPLPEHAALRQLLAEIQDDLSQMDSLVGDLVGRLPRAATWPPEEASYVALHLHRWYTAAESVFERIERVFVGAVPNSDNWHQDLLRLMSLPSEGARPAILQAATAQALFPYLRFRHFLRHAYAVSLDVSKLGSLVGPLQDVHAALTRDLGTLISDLRSALADG